MEFCQENALVIENTLFQQHKRRLYTCTSPDGQHRNQIDYILCSQRGRGFIRRRKLRVTLQQLHVYMLIGMRLADYALSKDDMTGQESDTDTDVSVPGVRSDAHT